MLTLLSVQRVLAGFSGVPDQRAWPEEASRCSSAGISFPRKPADYGTIRGNGFLSRLHPAVPANERRSWCSQEHLGTPADNSEESFAALPLVLAGLVFQFGNKKRDFAKDSL